jgi:hypothetical protein
VTRLPRVLLGFQSNKTDQSSDLKPVYSPTKRNTTFILDTSIQHGPGIVPYNSTLFYNSTAHTISAPFLRLGANWAPPTRDSVWTSDGTCICYRGDIIPYDWLNNDNMPCVSDRGYAWGFSSFITLVGLVLEAIWAIACWPIWLDANVNSELLRHGRSGAGVIRSVLDLAESLNRDLGADTCAYSDGELAQALQKCELVRYTIQTEGNVSHIGLGPQSLEGKLRLRDESTHYGSLEMQR